MTIIWCLQRVMKKDSIDHRTVIIQVLNFFNSGHKEFLAPVHTHDIDRRQHYCSVTATQLSTEAQVWPRHRIYIGGSTVLKEKRTSVCLLLSQEESEYCTELVITQESVQRLCGTIAR